MTHEPRIAISVALLLVTSAACRSQPAPAPRDEPSRFTLAIAERRNAAPSIATWGTMAAVVWSASTDAQTDIYSSVSSDGGATFAAPVRVNDVDGDARASGEQAARVTIGPGNVIHVAWPARHGDRSVIRYSSSADGGRSFSKAITVAGENLHGARGWHAMTLGYDGGVHAVWLDGRNAAPSTHRGPHAKHQSHAGGAKPAVMRDIRQDIFHASWKGDGPRSERAVAANVCFCCKTALATAGDRVYVAWRHIYPGGIRDVAVARSTDNGMTFSAPLRLSDDNWTIAGCPDDGPAMAVDMHGGIYITWPTLVDARKGIFYSSLVEGQRDLAFTPRIRLDSGDTEAAHPQIGADLHGKSAVVWDERSGSGRRIVLRRIAGGAPSDPVFFDSDGATYPVVAAIEHQWIVVWVAQASDGRSIIEGRRLPL
jgi:hypothetical protein